MIDMPSVTSAELIRKFGRYRDMAQREPVTITNHGRDSLVLLSNEEYQRLKRRDREVLRAGGHGRDLPEGAGDGESSRRACCSRRSS